MDYVRAGDAPSLIAEELGLTDEQVRQAFAYIEAHHPDIDAAYDAILDRVNQPNSDWIDEGTAKTWDELRRRIEARSAGEAVDACRRR